MSLDIQARRETLRLLDTYGGLLTAHQREAVRLHLEEDWSYAEIAHSQGVTRAAIYDLVHRARGALDEYEAKLGMVAAESRRGMERAAVQGRLEELESEVRSLRRAVKGLT